MYEYGLLLQAIFDHAERSPEKTALTVGNTRISYSVLCEHILKTALILHRLGIRNGDKIILLTNKVTTKKWNTEE